MDEKSANLRRLIDERTVESHYGVPRRILQKRRWKGLEPEFLKVGRRVYYQVGAIEAWLERCRRVSTSDPGTGRSA